VEFIDAAIEKQRARISAGKIKQKSDAVDIGPEEIQRVEKQIRELVDKCISTTILPALCAAKKRIEQNGQKADIDVDTSASIDLGKSYATRVKLLLKKDIVKTKSLSVTGPSLSFSAAPPYSTTINILAYGENNEAIFSERWELGEVTEEIVIRYIKKFVEEVIR
jgi:hypothetical protein